MSLFRAFAISAVAGACTSSAPTNGTFPDSNPDARATQASNDGQAPASESGSGPGRDAAASPDSASTFESGSDADVAIGADSGIGQPPEASAPADATAGADSGSPFIDASTSDSGAGRSIQARKQALVNLRFGMFLHFGILTFCGSQPGDPCPGSWAQPNLDITRFNPAALDPAQWAAAAKSAGMKFGVLTSRHHDGFALWPSAASAFNVGHIPWMGGKGDVVRQYVDAFRAAGLLPGLYYSIWDNTEGVGNGPVTPAQMTYLKTQLTELLTNYGPIPLLVFDGWSWKMGHHAVAYQEIHDLVKALQPDIVILDHNGLQSPFDEDIVIFEEPKGTFAPAGNRWAAAQDNKINGSGGNDWFWAPNIGNLMSVSTIVTGHLAALGPRYTDFILNCPPNRQGLLDPAIVTVLTQVGQSAAPAAVLPLPDQGIQNEHPITPIAATSTSGSAADAIDGKNDFGAYTVWQSAPTLPQSITLDLGAIVPNVGFLGYLPPYSNATRAPVPAGTITSYVVSVSGDNSAFTTVASGTWPADGALQHATFAPVAARYVRLQALSASGGVAAATEVTVGGAP